MLKPYYQDEYATIYHGDCREILPQLAPVDLVLTDPPYGTNNNCDYTRFSGGQRKNATLRQGRVWDSVSGDNEPFDPGFLLNFPNVVIWGANNFSDRLPAGAWLVWDKKHPGLEGKFMSDCEVAWKKGGCGVFLFRHVWDGFNRASEKGKHFHPTQKPVALFRWCLSLFPKANTVLDPFMGSGTTLRAAKDLGLKSIGIEIEEQYCEIAAKRLLQEVLWTSFDTELAAGGDSTARTGAPPVEGAA
jgi:site-specific DNA-methyltransferase (adenine-specific)